MSSFSIVQQVSKLVNTSDCKACPYRSMIFENLNTDQLRRVNKYRNERIFEKGEIICNQGDVIESFLYLKTGLVKIFQESDDSKPQIISIAKPLDFIGLLGIFSRDTYPFSISCIDESIICFVDLKVIKELIKEDGNFSLVFLEKMSQISESIWRSRLDLSRKNLRGRIAYILLEFSEKIYKNSQFDLPISRREMAELIDMTTENVIRILSEFRKDGILQITGKTISINKIDLLRQISLHG